MSSRREEAAARNEALFRDLNERISGINDAFAPVSGTETWVCECGDSDLHGGLTVPVETYQEVRQEPTRFLIKPGHQISDVEGVVSEESDHAVVEKHEGIGAERAREED